MGRVRAKAGGSKGSSAREMALQGVAQPSPQVVGGAFVQQYYFVLHKSPDLVHRFYQDSSIMSRPDSNGMMKSVTAMQAINDMVLSMDFSDYTAEIESADSQASYKDGVLVVVTGSLTGRDNIRRKFTQSFFLAPQEKGGYFVLNDIFRFIDPRQPRGANQVIVNGPNGDVSAASLTPEPEPNLVQEPQIANSVEHETLHTVGDIDNGEEAVNPTENDPTEGSVVVAADPEVHADQSDDQLVSEVAVSVFQEDGPMKSYASTVKVYKVGQQSSVLNSTPVSKLKNSLQKAASPKLDAVNPDKQPAPSSKPSTTFEATVTTGDNVHENSSNNVEGHSIYIRNLPLSTTPEEVEIEFQKFGPIKPGGVQIRNHKVERFCFGFVEFESLDSMQAAIKSSPITIGGRQAFVEEKRTTTRDACILSEVSLDTPKCSDIGTHGKKINLATKKKIKCLKNEVHENHSTDTSSLPDSIIHKVERALRSPFRKKLLVLDLNGILCDVVFDCHGSCLPYKRVSMRSVFKRPFLEDFLTFCFERFAVGIWSSRNKNKIIGVINYVMGDSKDRLLFCWDQSKCTFTGFNTLENRHKPLVLKELIKLWDKEEASLPWEKGEYSPSNTLLVDDSPYKALCNPPHTAIFPSPYDFRDEGDSGLGPGGAIRVYLESIAMADDVQEHVKKHSFGQEAITSKDKMWSFYKNVIDGNNSMASTRWR